MVDFPIRVVIKPEAAISGARQVRRALTTIENRADRLRQTIARTFLPVRLTIERQSLRSAGIRIKGVANQVDRLRKRITILNRLRLIGLERGFGRVGRAARVADRTIRRFFRNVSNQARKARFEIGGLQSLIFALGTGTGIAGVINLGRRFQNLTRRVRSVSVGSVELQKNLEAIRRVSKETGSAIEVNAQVFARLTIATRSLGLGSERTLKIVKTLQQSLIVGGATAQERRAAITQLSQALASGRLQGDELRSILESAPLLAENISKQLGITTGELRELGAAGELTADKLVFALEGAAGDIDEAFKLLGPSFDQSVARLNNSLVELGRSFQPFIENLGTSVERVAELLGLVGKLVGQFDRVRGAGGADEEARRGAASQTFIAGISGDPFRQGTIGVAGSESTRAPDFAVDVNRQSPQEQFQIQAQRLGNTVQAFDPSGDTSAQLAALIDKLKETGVTTNQLRAGIEALIKSDLDLAGRQELVANALGLTDAVLKEVAESTKRVAGVTANLVDIQSDSSEAALAAAAAEAQAGVARRRTEIALRSQIGALNDQKLLLQEEGVEREALAARLRAENKLRQAGIDTFNQSAIALIFNIEQLARENAERRESIKLQKEEDRDADRIKNQQLSRREQLLKAVRTEEEKRKKLTEEILALDQAGILLDGERARLLKELPGLIEQSNLGDFKDQLKEAAIEAQKLGDAFGQALVSGIGNASNALAEFVVSGARDIDSLREQLANILRDIAQDILAAIIKALILKAITSSTGIDISGARSGASANASRRFIVNESGPELFVPQSSPLAASAAANRARTHTSSSASRFATRQFGGPVQAGGGANNVDAFIPGSGNISGFSPPSAGQIVPAAQTAAILSQENRQQPVVVQAPAPQVEVTLNSTTMVDGKIVAQSVRDNEEVQVEVIKVVRENPDGIKQ